MFKKINYWLSGNSLFLAWAIAFVSLVGSLYFSEVLGFVPCVLCWYQRICMYPLLVIVGAGIIRKDKGISAYVLPLAMIGAVVALYQNLLIWHIIPENLAPCVLNSVSCITQSFVLLNFITLPLLSLVSFVLITWLMFVHRSVSRT